MFQKKLRLWLGLYSSSTFFSVRYRRDDALYFAVTISRLFNRIRDWARLMSTFTLSGILIPHFGAG